MQSGNVLIGKRLREAHAQWAMRTEASSRNIRLPSEAHIRFRESLGDFEIVMTPTATTANMQENCAAFEGWSIALRLWLAARSVTLHWSPPPRESNHRVNRHYARFLYRVQRFQSLFPEWFKIGPADHLQDCAVRGGDDLFLNVAGATSRKPLQPKPETEIERALVGRHHDSFCEAFGLTKADRQFPVGLYETSDRKRAVFTAGTSAIDITGTDGEILTVFELKAGPNIMVGAIGELLFYASVLRDAAGSSPRFQFAGGVAKRSSMGPDDVRAAQAIRAVLLGEEFHPLLEHPELISTLNGAAAKQFREQVPLSFEAWRIRDFSTEVAPIFEPIARTA